MFVRTLTFVLMLFLAAAVQAATCGNGNLEAGEQCDDGNAVSGDGCSSSCQVEAGWTCASANAACFAKQCGDGIVAGNEQCDDGNTTSGDGCSATCKLESGFACVNQGAPPKSVCHATHCGDGVREGFEECDDGSVVPYDGCSSTCRTEPACAGGTCTATCGDGVKFPQEQCDDGNKVDGDGCSSTCTTESGWTCSAITQSSSGVAIPILYRDRLYSGTTIPGQGHPDFNSFGCGVVTGLVQSTLGADSEPVFGPNGTSCLTNAPDFCWWYHQTGCSGGGSTNPYDRLVYLDQSGNPTTLTLSGIQFSSTQFYPIDNLGWNAGANPQTGSDCGGSTGHNFSFTSELHYPFTYHAASSPTLSFTGDDDFWAFINGHLAIDLGGVHGSTTGSVTLNAATATSLGLVDGGTYSIDVFQAERHTCASDYTLSLNSFTHTVSQCSTICGDGLVRGNEVCDDGLNNGAYGGCMPGCLARGPYCGDGVVHSPEEQCDDGNNTTTYGGTSQVCGPGCKFAPYCGDGVVSNGEQCDDGAQNGSGYGHCQATCTLGPRCGDGTIQALAGEQCDDGNAGSGDGCSATCQIEAGYVCPSPGSPCQPLTTSTAPPASTPTPTLTPTSTAPPTSTPMATPTLTSTALPTSTPMATPTPTATPDDAGFIPPDAKTNACEDLVARHLSTLFRCMMACHIKAADAARTGKPFDEEACEQGTQKKPVSCRTAFDNATNRLLSAKVATCPACLDATAQSDLADQVMTFVEGKSGQNYCAGMTPLP